MSRNSIILAIGVAIGLLGGPVLAQSGSGLSGSYLAARQAGFNGDYRAAAQYYARALRADPGNPEMMERAVLANFSMGRLDRAITMAETLEANEFDSQIANMALVTSAAARDDFADLEARIRDSKGIGPLVDGLLLGWAQLGAGELQGSMDAFDEVALEDAFKGFAAYHRAMALASIGDFERADEIFASGAMGALQRTRRAVLANVEVLSQLERNDEAQKLIMDSFRADLDPGLSKIVADLEAGRMLPFTYVDTARDGIAEVFFTLAGALSNESNDDFTLLYSRIAEHLSPTHIDAILLSAELLERLGQPELAVETYERVPTDSASYHAAELGRAGALRDAGQIEASVEVLRGLARTHGDLAVVQTALGDAMRQDEQYAEAAEAYSNALALHEEPGRSEWFLFYVRAITYERLDQWDLAEADFRKALELNPNQPQVLNYLGYSLVQKQIKLDEALSMIETAVAERPQSGYIVDSLGWVLYKLGRYDEAVGHMERAAELMPIDPIVNDHLGDVYWAVGRKREAEFQWKRALSFADHGTAAEPADVDRIRRKLEVGLDVVLEEEGAEPLKVANGGGD